MRPRLLASLTGFTIALCALVPASGLAAPVPAIAGAVMLAGNWAGDNFSLRVTRDGAMVQGKCANGKITAPIQLDPKGRFSAAGYFNPYTSGFRLSDLAPRDQPAQFSGQVSGNVLELRLLSDTVPSKPVYKLRRDARIKFDDCGRGTNNGVN